MRHDFISLADLSSDEVYELLDLAADLKARHHAGKDEPLLAGQTLAMVFEKPSLRTRVTFQAGIFQFGGQGIELNTDGKRLGERETVPDVARNLERWVDGICARTFSHEAVVELAENAAVPVINALTDKLHPCQVVADAQALREHRSDLAGLKVAFMGDGNNVCASWLHFAARVPIDFTLVCPPGYEADPEILAFAQAEGKGTIAQTNDVESGLAGADAIYTDVWASMGQEDEKDERVSVFQPYQVNATTMAMANDDALFMHCLPAKRGEEVTDEVVDSDRSIVFDQAENRLHAQKAVMLKLMKKGDDGLCDKQRARRADK